MRRKLFNKTVLVLIFSFVSAVFSTLVTHAYGFFQISDFIQAHIKHARTFDSLWIGCEKMHAGKDLLEYYENRFYKPVWVSVEGLSDHGRKFIDAVADAGMHGLARQDYHYDCLNEWAGTLEKRAEKYLAYNMEELAGLDIVMTDAFLNFGSHLANGKVDPEKIHPQWVSAKTRTDVFSALDEVAEYADVQKVLIDLAPPYAQYWSLLNKAEWYRRAQDQEKWPLVAEGKAIRYMERDHRVPALRQRLEITGHMNPSEISRGDLYDFELERAVRKFQRDHGLEADGIVGKKTLAELNVSPRNRRKQILINLERWRWLPRNLGQRHIRVNTASFHLEAVDNGEVHLDMRVIVGKNYQKTPVFSKQLQYLEFNPYWNVPREIVKREILPKIIKNPEYLDVNNYEIVSGWDENSPVVDHSTIDWETVGTGNFPGRVRQTPGPWNALGQIKFMFPNKFDVYLHDTPEKNLFQNNYRALSHGCIRLEKPLDLALFVLQDDPVWSGRKKIEKTLIILIYQTTTLSPPIEHPTIPTVYVSGRAAGTSFIRPTRRNIRCNTGDMPLAKTLSIGRTCLMPFIPDLKKRFIPALVMWKKTGS